MFKFLYYIIISIKIIFGRKTMIDVNKNNLMKYLLFSSLYFSEGILWIIASLILPIYLVEKDVSLPLTTLVSGIFMLPMTIKFVWGGIVDYFIQFGRKRFIILGVLLSSIGLIPLAVIDPGIFLVPFAFLLFSAGSFFFLKILDS